MVRMVAISVFVSKLDDFWIAREWRSGSGGGFDLVSLFGEIKRGLTPWRAYGKASERLIV